MKFLKSCFIIIRNKYVVKQLTSNTIVTLQIWFYFFSAHKIHFVARSPSKVCEWAKLKLVGICVFICVWVQIAVFPYSHSKVWVLLCHHFHHFVFSFFVFVFLYFWFWKVSFKLFYLNKSPARRSKRLHRSCLNISCPIGATKIKQAIQYCSSYDGKSTIYEKLAPLFVTRTANDLWVPLTNKILDTYLCPKCMSHWCYLAKHRSPLLCWQKFDWRCGVSVDRGHTSFTSCFYLALILYRPSCERAVQMLMQFGNSNRR